ncbi:MAG: TlpA family protein disulfide reductase [Bacteroidia bacterium]|nr:TlpA family protein disulfide reductase [Bacteroidia bacterium]
MKISKGKITLYLTILIISVLNACKEEIKKVELKQGTWRVEILMQNQQLPFNLEISKDGEKYKANLINGPEIIPLDEVEIHNDSVFIGLHIFDIDLRAKINGDTLDGLYIKNYKDDYKVPFRATYGITSRFDDPQASTQFDGKWQTTFTDEDGNTYPAVGIFKKEGKLLTGTFLTETGDYRYLEGFTEGNKMRLFTFDGNHAFIFNATVQNDSLQGEFLSGKSYKETFVAYKDENAKLANANELTFLKEGYKEMAFTFPGLDGKPVSLSDKKYKGKVVLLQIFGTWCPNCMDETKFYANWYDKNKKKGVEIIGLAYEAKDDFEYAKKRVEKMKEKYDVNYDYVIAGVYDKEAAAKSLPMLNHILSFPTTIFIDKKGKVRRIHTGFSGPATGIYYEEYVDEFNTFMSELLNE